MNDAFSIPHFLRRRIRCLPNITAAFATVLNSDKHLHVVHNLQCESLPSFTTGRNLKASRRVDLPTLDEGALHVMNTTS